MAMVENLTSRNGNKVSNQFKLYLASGVAFQSYSTMIACKMYGTNKVYLSNSWDYSNTTMKYLKDFLGTTASAKEIRNRIKEGEYVVVSESQIEHLATTGEQFK